MVTAASASIWCAKTSWVFFSQSLKFLPTAVARTKRGGVNFGYVLAPNAGGISFVALLPHQVLVGA